MTRAIAVASALWAAVGWCALPRPGRLRGVTAGPGERRVARRWRRTSTAARDSAAAWSLAEVASLADRMAALARAGLTEDQAWRALAEAADSPGAVARIVSRTTSLGGSDAEGLRRAAEALSGSVAPESVRALHWLALAFEVSRSCGAPLAQVLDGVADALRQQLAADRERETALAGPRATATVLTWLPLAGLALGALIGMNLPAVLLMTPAGRTALLVGGLLWWAGRFWISRLVRRAASV